MGPNWLGFTPDTTARYRNPGIRQGCRYNTNPYLRGPGPTNLLGLASSRKGLFFFLFTILPCVPEELVRHTITAIMEDGTRAQDSPVVDRDGQQDNRSTIRQIWTHSWFQILLISFICFCCPGVGISNNLDIARRVLILDSRRCTMPSPDWEALVRSIKRWLQMPTSRYSPQRLQPRYSWLGRSLTVLVRECVSYWAVGPIPCILEVSCASTVRVFKLEADGWIANCLS